MICKELHEELGHLMDDGVTSLVMIVFMIVHRIGSGVMVVVGATAVLRGFGGHGTHDEINR